MAFRKTDDVSQKKKTASAFTFNLLLYPRFKMVFLCECAFVRARMLLLYSCLMHANESGKRQLHLISINGHTVQEGQRHAHAHTHIPVRESIRRQ